MPRTESSKAVRFLAPLDRFMSRRLRKGGGGHGAQGAVQRTPASDSNGEPILADNRGSSPVVVRDITIPNTPEQDTNNAEVIHSQITVSTSQIDTSFSGAHLDYATPAPGDDDEILKGAQGRWPRNSDGDLKVLTSFDRSASTVTDIAPKPCSNGGRDYESTYLRARYNPPSSSDGIPASAPPRRDYRKSKKPILRQVLIDLTSNSTVVQSALNPKSKFVPCTVLHDIMTFETLHLIFSEIFKQEQWTAQDIQRIAPRDRSKTGLRRIFAILIIINKHYDILRLLQLDQDLDDTYLPALDDPAHPSPTPEQTLLEDFFERQDWIDREKTLFRQTQWELMPVFFGNEGGHDVHYQCRSGDVLPLVKHVGGIHKQGGYGEVTSYLLHKDQQSLKRYTTRGAEHPVVVKRPHRLENRDDFDKEIDVLRRLTRSKRGQNHHLAKLLATFEVPKCASGTTGTDYYMMFEWADKTLDDLFKEARPTGRASDLHEWVAEQALGLATALRAMHKLKKAPDDPDDKTRGIHGDLKPPNILVYRNWNYPEGYRDGGRRDADTSDEELEIEGGSEGGLSSGSRTHSDGLGILQITDFGRSSFHHTLTVEDIKFTTLGGDYCPPELQLKLSVSPSLDIWTLGCLYLEILTWVLEGREGIDAFREKRDKTPGFLMDCHQCFYSVRGKEDGGEGIHISVSEAVLKWATRLYNSKNGSEFTRELLKLVLERMLVVEDKNNARRFKSVPDQRPEGVTRGRGRQRVDSGGASANRISTKDFGGEPGAPESPPASEVRQISRIPARELVQRLRDIRSGKGGSDYFAPSPVKKPHDFYGLPRNAIYSPSSYTQLIMEMKAEDADKKKKKKG
ncbi:protein kinase-like (PK-like) protein [Colletotrichum sojae]|uniref:Protein kinase-like (PK-like) protein n=1 Tax=Colletotrichum sojae TaxID=2175907 RepID=A0A8H6J7E2_9PEZI|nr:protein kinase-like (PK-like) protein [Colletotrichum sojae]